MLMAWWNPFKKKPKQEVTQTITAPTTSGIKVTDYTSGESVKTTTTTSPSGKTTSSYVYRGGGGSSRGADVIQATQKLDAINQAKAQAQENAKRIAEQEAQARATAQAQAEARRQAQEQARIQAGTQAQQNIQLSAQQQADLQRIANQNKGYDYGQGTRTDLIEPPKNLPPIQTQPYVEKRVVDTFRDKDTGRKIPVTEIVYVDPTGKDLGGGASMQTERKATTEEIKYYNEQTNNLEIVPLSRTEKVFQNVGLLKEYKSATGGAVGLYENLNTGFKQSFTDVLLPVDIDKLEKNAQQSTDFLISKGVPKPIAYTGEFIAGAGLGILEDVKYNPLKNIVILGVTAGVGAGVSGVIAGASRISPLVGTLTRTGITGAGVYFAGKEVYSTGAIISKELKEGDYLTAGKTLGVTSKDLGLAVVGYNLGVKGYAKIKTLGRNYDPIENIVLRDVLSGKKTFTESSSYGYKGGSVLDKQKFDLKIFQDKKYGYHVTPDKFWIDAIKVTEGTSEFKGLYVAPDASIYFSKVGGGYKLFPNLAELTSARNPAIAKIYPTGFDISSFIKVKGGGYKFLKSDLGTGYVSGIKPEIESIFPTGSEFVKFGKGSYTKFKGQYILIDNFKVVDNILKNDLVPSVSGREISSSYGSIGKQALVYPEVFSVSSYGSSNKINVADSLIYDVPSSQGSISSYSGSSVMSDITSPLSSGSYKPSSRSGSSRSFKSSLEIPSSIYSDTSFISKPSKSSYKSKYTPSPRSSILGSFYYPKLPSYRNLAPPVSAFKTPKRGIKKVETYSVSIKRRGKFQTIGGDLTFNKALRIGEEKSLGSLGRTIKIKKTGFKEVGIDESFAEPDLKKFRSFRIKQGKKEALPFGTFIEKRGFGFATKSAQAEAQYFRKLSPKGKKKNKLFSGLID
jgi:hypothetical protein